MFSLENGTEYRADFVLATLLDAASSSQQPTTVQEPINASTTASSSITQDKAQTRNGHGTMSVDELDLTNGLNDTSHGTRTLSTSHNKRTNTVSRILDRRDNQTSSNPHRTRNTDFNFPSGSQFTRTGKHTQPESNVRSKVMQQSSESRVPPPPDDDMEFDFMDTDVDDHGCQAMMEHEETQRDKRSQAFTLKDQSGVSRSMTGLSERVASGNFDVMDAIFGDENLNDVADEGNQFGFGIEKQIRGEDKGQYLSSYKGKDSEKSKRIGKKTGQSHKVTKSATLSGRSLETEESLTQMESQEATTQDSIINDSGFLPSTPPAKKVSLFVDCKPGNSNNNQVVSVALQHKPMPYSVLFGMDMFPHDQNTSEVLAPDSDSDGE